MGIKPTNMLLLSCILLTIHLVRSDYWTERQKLIDTDSEYAVGADMTLDDNEEKLNEILMKYKLEEYDDGFENPEKFLPAQHFFHSKPLIEASNVFKFIQQIPKGASLHGHDSALLSYEGLYNLTFREHLYACEELENLKLHFFKTPPTDGCNWKLVSDLRNEDPTFDTFLRSELTLEVENPAEEYSDINAVWNRFSSLFGKVVPMITYKPIFEEYFYYALQELYDDNIMYVEFRAQLPPVYDLEGNMYKEKEVAGMYKDTIELFKSKNKNFLGGRFIYAPSRNVDNATMDTYMKTAKMLKLEYPDFMAGFDLVGQEDLGKPLSNFLSDLQDISKSMNLYLHAAETNWYGASTDTNLFDAIMLGTKRIGHGFSIVKHPLIMEIIKERKISIEISPISNQVLALVDDIRNHPGNIMIAHGLPVVICNDDPQFWGAKALSYDWYIAFMGMTSRNTDLRFLKQIAMNSLLYSGLETDFRMDAITRWQNEWQAFVQNMLQYYSEI